MMKLFRQGLIAGSILLICLMGSRLCGAETLMVVSPNQQMKISISYKDVLQYSVQFKDQTVIFPSMIGLELEDQCLGKNPILSGTATRTVWETIHPVIPEKRSEIIDHFNEMTLRFEGDYDLVVRAYDDGVAYRFVTRKNGSIKIGNEQATFNFSSGDHAYCPMTRSFHNSFESEYTYLPVGDIAPQQLVFLPVLVDRQDGLKVLVTEADLVDYPGMFITGGEGNEPVLHGTFSPYPLEETQEGDRKLLVTKSADYIAITDGNRSFPWRVFLVTDRDGSLIENDMVYRLAPPCQLDDTSWIKPGKVAWDWWNALNLFGVNFKSGVNTQTYKYYIDFAARYGLEYIILDEGWSDTENLLKLNPDLDLHELIAYGKQKNVRIILWCIFLTLDKQLEEALDRFQEWGIAGIKVDFMDRDDQKMVNFYTKIARETAKRQLLLDFHGAYKPTGLRRTYPNLITREGVKGLENNKWSDLPDPEYNVQLPFIRMVAGPMDYTPGATVNAQQSQFQPIFNHPMSRGTRAHQMALYVVFESPLQMLADSPSRYLREPEMMDFLSTVPTTWDETRVLDAKVSDYVLIARRHGQDWYVGALTDWTPRVLDLDFSFLGKGIYQADIYQDGVNADQVGSDYLLTTKIVRPEDKVKIDLQSGGGWTARIIRMK